MKIAFDPAKDAANLVKHGISLAAAVSLDWDDAWIEPDARSPYGEPRMIGIGYIGTRLFVDRGDDRRIISLRKANSREVRRYAET